MTGQENDRIHEEIVRQATSKNVTVLTGEVGGEEVFFLVREEINFIGYLADKNKKGELEVIGSAIKPDGLKFFYYDHNSEAHPGWADQWNNAYFPFIVRVELEFQFVEEDSNTFTIEEKVFIPVNNYKLIEDESIG